MFIWVNDISSWKPEPFFWFAVNWTLQCSEATPSSVLGCCSQQCWLKQSVQSAKYAIIHPAQNFFTLERYWDLIYIPLWRVRTTTIIQKLRLTSIPLRLTSIPCSIFQFHFSVVSPNSFSPRKQLVFSECSFSYSEHFIWMNSKYVIFCDCLFLFSIVSSQGSLLVHTYQCFIPFYCQMVFCIFMQNYLCIH